MGAMISPTYVLPVSQKSTYMEVGLVGLAPQTARPYAIVRESKIEPVFDHSHDVAEPSVRWYFVPAHHVPPVKDVALKVRLFQLETANEPGAKVAALT
jgi:hypothetical protein